MPHDAFQVIGGKMHAKIVYASIAIFICFRYVKGQRGRITVHYWAVLIPSTFPIKMGFGGNLGCCEFVITFIKVTVCCEFLDCAGCHCCL